MLSKLAAALTFVIITLNAASAGVSTAEDALRLIYRNGRFEPSVLSVPAGQALKLKVTNMGDAPIEFESFELNRERVVLPGRTITVYLPSLSPGTYNFFDDFHHGAGQGTISAK